MAINKPNKVIWHHSATNDGKVLNDFRSICNYHTNVKGWPPPCGYHLVIEYVNNKLVCHKGLDFKRQGAHTIGENLTSLGVCVVGNFDVTNPVQELYEFCASVYMQYIYPVYGNLKNERHSRYANKSCPGKNFNLEKIDFLISRFGVKEVVNYADMEKGISKAFDRQIITSEAYWVKKGKNDIDVKKLFENINLKM